MITRRFTATVGDVTTAFAQEAVRIHQGGHLTDRQIARATGAAPSTVRSWLNGRSAPTGERAERVAELSALVGRLARVVAPDYIPVWMTKPIEALDDEKPIDVLARGEYRRVAAVVRTLEHPGAT
jgi:transcriptional regulator with XRE-family HTH domain